MAFFLSHSLLPKLYLIFFNIMINLISNRSGRITITKFVSKLDRSTVLMHYIQAGVDHFELQNKKPEKPDRDQIGADL